MICQCVSKESITLFTCIDGAFGGRNMPWKKLIWHLRLHLRIGYMEQPARNKVDLVLIDWYIASKNHQSAASNH